MLYEDLSGGTCRNKMDNNERATDCNGVIVQFSWLSPNADLVLGISWAFVRYALRVRPGKARRISAGKTRRIRLDLGITLEQTSRPVYGIVLFFIALLARARQVSFVSNVLKG